MYWPRIIVTRDGQHKESTTVWLVNVIPRSLSACSRGIWSNSFQSRSSARIITTLRNAGEATRSTVGSGSGKTSDASPSTPESLVGAAAADATVGPEEYSLMPNTPMVTAAMVATLVMVTVFRRRREAR